MQHRKFTLSMKLRADSVLQQSSKSPEKPPHYSHNYSLPKIEQGWTAALRMTDEKEERIRRMKASRSNAPLTHIYERMSGLHETEINLGQFPDRGQIIHPSVLCARCSDPAAICVPCSEQLIQDGISVYINSRAKGATYLFHNAISRSASSTVLRFVVFKIWSNSMFTRRVMRQRRIVHSRQRHFRKLCFLPFRSWQRYVSDIIHEKKDRKSMNLEKRVKQLEEQLLKLAAEHKTLNAEHDNTCKQLAEEKDLCEERRLKIIELEDRVTLDEKKISFLSGFMPPLLQVAHSLEGLYSERVAHIISAKPSTSQLKLVTPPLPHTPMAVVQQQYDTLMRWVNDTAASINPHVTVRGIVPLDYLPIAEPAAAVESLSDGKLLSCAVFSLIINSDAIKLVPIAPVELEPSAVVQPDQVADDETAPASAEPIADVAVAEVERESNADAANPIPETEEDSPAQGDEGIVAEQAPVPTVEPVREAPVQPIKYDIDESTSDGNKAVETLINLLNDLNNNRASPHDLITLSMKAAGYFLNIPIADLEENLSLDSITCILYRISHLRMFTASLHGFELTLLPEDIKMVNELQYMAQCSKNKLVSVISDIEKIAELRRETAVVPEVECEIGSELGSSPAGDADLKGGEDIVTTAETRNVVEVVIDEPSESPALQCTDSGIKECTSPVEGSEGRHDAVEEEEISVVDPMTQLHLVIERIVCSESAEQVTSDFMVHLDNMLVGLRKIFTLVDARREAMDEASVQSVYATANNHGFVTQKTFNYLQF